MLQLHIIYSLFQLFSGFERQSDQTRDYKIGICCFTGMHAPLRRKNKDWLAQNQDKSMCQRRVTYVDRRTVVSVS
jgi:hypothetical protein